MERIKERDWEGTEMKRVMERNDERGRERRREEEDVGKRKEEGK